MGVKSLIHRRPPDDIEVLEEPFCVAGIQRLRRATITNGVATITWRATDGTIVAVTAPQAAAAVAGRCGQVTPYSVLPSCAALPPPSGKFDNITLVMASPGEIADNITRIIDGSDFGPLFARLVGASLVLDLTYTVPLSNVNAVLLWNNGGNDLFDFDGITGGLVELFDGAGNLLWSGPIIAGNGAAPFATPVPILNGVKRLRLSQVTSAPGFRGLVREIQLRLEPAVPLVPVNTNDAPRMRIDQAARDVGCNDDRRDQYLSRLATAVVGVPVVTRQLLTANAPANPFTRPNGMRKVAVRNVGTTDGTFMGVAILPGQTVSFEGYTDENTRTFKRLGYLDWTASATAILLMTITQ